MSLRFALLDPDAVRSIGPALSAIERQITYPIADGADRFFVDHGEDYGAFFASMGVARFLVAFDGDEVVGVLAAAKKPLRDPRGARGEAIYLGDLKLAPAWRGGRVAPALLRTGLTLLATHPLARGFDFVFGAGMQGARGDVRRSFRGALHPGRLGRPWAALRLYFVAPEALRALVGEGPTVTAPGLDLSDTTSGGPLVVRNHGRKDFRLLSTGAPWRLAHLPRAPDRWGAGLGVMLRAAAEALAPDELACFALDGRLEAPVSWLAAQGVQSGAAAHVLAMPHPCLGWRRAAGAAWVHLSTAEF